MAIFPTKFSEQMSNWLGVEHRPGTVCISFFIFVGRFFFDGAFVASFLECLNKGNISKSVPLTIVYCLLILLMAEIWLTTVWMYETL